MDDAMPQIDQQLDDAIAELRRSADSLGRVAEIIDPEFAVKLFEEGYPDAIIVVDLRGNIALVNRQLELMFGYHRSEMYDQPVEMLIPDSVREAHVRHRQNYNDNPYTRPMGLGMDLQGRKKNGTLFDVEISLAPIMVRQGYFVVATVRKRRAD